MSQPAPNEHEAAGAGRGGGSRRAFLWTGLGLVLAGCAGENKTETLTKLPGPAWDEYPVDGVVDPVDVSMPVAGTSVLSRSTWARGRPVPALMDPMKPIRYITVHHDGMQPFEGNRRSDAAARLERIRRGHRGENWGDIGYHFAIDRSGNVWGCRPLRYQGAHVKDHNEGNIGVVVLGNFEEQHPTSAQINGVRVHVAALMRHYRVPVSRIRTHREWAPTACPGRSLQREMVTMRRVGL